MKTYTTLISAEELKGLLGSPQLVIVDCQFVMKEPEKGLQIYQDAHIPGAVFADMDKDLTGEVVSGENKPTPIAAHRTDGAGVFTVGH